MDRLLQIILGTELDGTDSIRDTGIIRHDNKRDFHTGMHHPFQKADTVPFRQTYIPQYQADFMSLQNNTCPGLVYCGQDFVTGFLKPLFYHTLEYHIIFNYQYFHISQVLFLFLLSIFQECQ